MSLAIGSIYPEIKVNISGSVGVLDRMKTSMLLVFVVSVGFGSLLTAQNPPVPTTKKHSAHSQKEHVFSANHSINLQGTLPSGKAVNVSTIGVGPLFFVNVPIDGEGNTLSCRYSVMEQDGKYLISYTVAVQARIESGRANGPRNFEYREYTVEGKAICEVGTAVEIFRNGEEVLSLSVDEILEKKSIEPNPEGQ
ncbi:MAG: hypothetical protein Q7Q71_14445 [Verrucomicrobiota bacterium JB023]|nr:hypothetical protein [Verrucomicrobiota bacterium JB023]